MKENLVNQRTSSYDFAVIGYDILSSIYSPSFDVAMMVENRHYFSNTINHTQ